MIKKCLQCGESFEAKRSDAKYCSDKCRKAFKRAIVKAAREPITCIICGARFIPEHGHQKYCSNECSEIARVLDQRDHNIGQYDPLDWLDDGDPFDSLE